MLSADQIAATSEQQQAASARDSAEADCLLAASEAAIERSNTAHSRAQAADAALARIESARRGLPAKLAETDERIATAAVALEAASAPVRASNLATFETELGASVDQLCAVLVKGYALAAAGVVASRYLDEITIPSPVPGVAPLLADGRSTTNGSTLALNTSWRENEQAVALHEEYAPVHRTAVQLRPHLARIELARERARVAANTEGRRQSFDRTRGSITPRADVSTLPTATEHLPPPSVEADWLTAARGHR